MEQQVMWAEKLSMTGRIARTIAHEIRNPLTNVNLALEELEDELADDNLKIYYSIIKKNSRRIEELIADLLNSAKPSELAPVRSSINELLDEAVELSRDRLNLKNMKLEKKI